MQESQYKQKYINVLNYSIIDSYFNKSLYIFNLTNFWEMYNVNMLSPGINIDISVNAAFMADKLNAAKSYADITDCWHVHYKYTKTFQSSLSCYDGVNRQRELYCCYCSSLVGIESLVCSYAQ